ncbi:hypothetical protein HGM15179_004641 [Zosterops borbonicus]|uniref:Uncharacterized protein n=1 Tax=Zosterops borbonicus TaxID=364589 RepID=A0A8K1GRI6_9PASS|nr:hypothetical protein HGM15179_004641 [Zosterops borbonicus]
MSVSLQGHEAQSKCDPRENQVPKKLTENIATSGLIMKKSKHILQAVNARKEYCSSMRVFGYVDIANGE